MNKQFQLNLYELHRKPLTIKQRSDANNKISIKSSILESLLTCPICLDVLDHAMVTKACLHRFCKDCITTALRQANQECPTCRKKMVSKRDLREDPNFDALINKLFPKRKEIYEKEQEDLRKLVSSHATSLQESAAAHGVLMEDGEGSGLGGKATRKPRKRKSANANQAANNQNANSLNSTIERDAVGNSQTKLSPKVKKSASSIYDDLEQDLLEEDSLPGPVRSKKSKSGSGSASVYQYDTDMASDFGSQSSIKSSANNVSDAESTLESKEDLYREDDTVIEEELSDETRVHLTFKIFTSKKQLDSAREKLYVALPLGQLRTKTEVAATENEGEVETIPDEASSQTPLPTFEKVKIGHLNQLLLTFARFEDYVGVEIGQLDHNAGFKAIDNEVNILKVLSQGEMDAEMVLYVRRARKSK